MRKRGERVNYEKAILSVVSITGLLLVAAVAPNCLQLLRFHPSLASKKKFYINGVIPRLKKSGLIEFTHNKQGQKVIRLTAAGKQKLREYELEEKSLARPKRWDGKYRVIAFDIKEWKKTKRDSLRLWLARHNVVRLQNSVWISPYDCEEIIVLLKAKHKLGKEVIYMEVSYLENDLWLRRHFNLPLNG
jgi:DNA-binding transcriptional regulator PaaX